MPLIPPSTWEAEAIDLCELKGKPGLHDELQDSQGDTQ